LFDSPNHVRSVRHPLLPLVTYDFSELALVTEKLQLPGAGNFEERLCYVDFLHIRKAGGVHQDVERTSGRSRSGAETNCNPVVRLRQSGGNGDRQKSHPARGAKNPFACPQHGELGAKSTENVGVHYGVDRVLCEGKVSS
jgi:hypothetical protein